METRNIAIGVLFAPDSGNNTRKMIADKSSDYSGEFETKFNDLMAGMSHKFAALKEEALVMAEQSQQDRKDM